MAPKPAGSSNNQLLRWAQKAASLFVTAPVANSSLANMNASTFKARDSGGGAGPPQDLTGTQATALLDVFTSTLKGLAPLSGGGTTNFLRADGTWNSAGLAAGTQADQEAASSLTVAVTPGRQQFHPSAAKAWVRFDVAGVRDSNYNVSSITDNGTGDWTVNFGTAFSSATAYSGVAFGSEGGGGLVRIVEQNITTAPTTTAFRLSARATGGALADVGDKVYAAFFGDQ